MRIFILTEGSEKTGLGHLYRVKTFALNCLKNDSVELKIRSFVDKKLESIFRDLDNYIVNPKAKLIQEIKAFSPNFVIFDLLEIDNQLFGEINGLGIKLVSLSPIFSHLSAVDYLFTRGNLLVPEGPQVFSGMEYVIIGNHVKRIPEELYRMNIESSQLPIAITLGGTDAPNKTLKVLKTLVRYDKSLLIWVLLGEGYRHSYTELVNVIRENSQHEIILARTNNSMWNILQNTVLAITAGGLTAYEAAAAGLPTINIVANKTHLNLLSELFEKGVSFNSGVFPDFNENDLLNYIDGFDKDRMKLINLYIQTKNIHKKLTNNEILNKLIEIKNDSEN